MKLGIISDVHNNIVALKKVIEELRKINVDEIYCVGDIVGNGAYPEETVQYVSKLSNFYAVKGNHDIFMNLDLKYLNSNDARVKFFRWQQRLLSTFSKKYLNELPLKIEKIINGFKFVFFHYPLNKNGRFKELVYLPSESQTKELFKGLSGDVFVFGHEHTGSLQKIDNKYYLNFGSLGNFLEEGIARYGVIDIDANNLNYQLKTVNYDSTASLKTVNSINNLLNCKS